MKIDSSIATQIPTDASLTGTRTAGASGTAATKGAAAPVPTDRATVSAAGAQMGAMSSDFDADKVAAIRKAISEGKFTVNASAIADRLIADAAALLGPRTN